MKKSFIGKKDQNNYFLYQAINMKKKNLSFFFKKNNCDKFTHQYHTVYEKYLSKNKNKKLNIFEIGVADGSSLKSWSAFFKKSNIIGIDIKKINLKKRGIDKKNIKVYEGSQTDKKILSNIISKYKNFDIIIDDGSHYPNDVIKTFEILFPFLKINGLYFIEDLQTSYNHFFKGNAFDLKYSSTHMNFFKNITDSLNYKEIANPFYAKNKYDGLISEVSFYNNMVVLKKGINEIESNLVEKNSYEEKRYKTKILRGGSKIKYFFKYKILFKSYTLILFLINFVKKIILLRI